MRTVNTSQSLKTNRAHEDAIHAQVKRVMDEQQARIKANPKPEFDKEVAELFERTPKGPKGDDAIFEGIDALKKKHYQAESYMEAHKRIKQAHEGAQSLEQSPASAQSPSTVGKEYLDLRATVGPLSELAKKTNRSLMALLRDAVNDYLKAHSAGPVTMTHEKAP
jgi:hypothetical protein